MEEEIIVLLDEVEKAETEANKEKEILAVEEKKLKEEEIKVKDRIKEIESELGSLNKQREPILLQLESNILTHYERVLKNREGYALAKVINDACGGCQMELPPQTINEIRLKERVINCEVCNRILYII